MTRFVPENKPPVDEVPVKLVFRPNGDVTLVAGDDWNVVSLGAATGKLFRHPSCTADGLTTDADGYIELEN